jgi:glucose-1-phosphate adenylyltransferase
VRESNPEHVLILAGDHIYKMDYGPMIAYHASKEADITVGVIEVPVAEATAFGVMTVDDSNRINRFVEKPANPEPMPGTTDIALASMGIYVFDTEFLCDKLINDANNPDSAHDFGRNIVPGSIAAGERVFAYPFHDVETKAQSYWRDVGTVDGFFNANLELAQVRPELNLYDDQWPIWTYQEQLPPAKFILDTPNRRGMAINSLVSGGCIVSGAEVRESILFSNVRVREGSRLFRAVVLPRATIGGDCRISRAIIDEDCVIPDGTVIGEDAEEDARRFVRTEGGVVLVCPHMLQ